MTKFAQSSFSVGGAGSAAYDANYEATFGKKASERDCTRCLGVGSVNDTTCDACAGTGLRAYQVSRLPGI